MSAMIQKHERLYGCRYNGSDWAVGDVAVGLAREGETLPEHTAFNVRRLVANIKAKAKADPWLPLKPVTVNGRQFRLAFTEPPRTEVYIFAGSRDRVFLDANALEEVADRAGVEVAGLTLEQVGRKHDRHVRVKIGKRVVGWIMPIRVPGPAS